MTVVTDLSAPLVVVVGATGVQGGSVVRNLIESDKPYRLRGLSRDASKPAAAKLKELGVEVVSVIIAVDNAPAVREAFAGAEVVFAVTNFWDHMDAAREVAEGKLMVDAAKAVGVKLFVWSGLESFSAATNGRFSRVVHFDSKAEITQYAFSQLPTVEVQAGFYMTNLATIFPPRKLDDGSFVWDHPLAGSQKRLPYIDIERDYGLFVRYAIETPSFRQGRKTIYTLGEMLLNTEAAAILQRVRGIKLAVDPLPLDTWLAASNAAGMTPLALGIFEDLLGAVEHSEGGIYFGKESTPEQQEIRKAVANLRRPRSFEEFLVANPEFFKY